MWQVQIRAQDSKAKVYSKDEGDEYLAKECPKYSKAEAMVACIEGEACGALSLLWRKWQLLLYKDILQPDRKACL